MQMLLICGILTFKNWQNCQLYGLRPDNLQEVYYTLFKRYKKKKEKLFRF